MAINSLDVPCHKPAQKFPNSTNSSCLGAGLSTCRLVKINFATEGSIISSTGSKRSRKKNADSKSPYLDGDNTHLHSKVTEKTIIHKKATAEYVSSYPMAVNIYKASSDEFNRLKKANKKPKKSVLTLPNTAPTLQSCTVSDMNDSEYFNEVESRKKIKKRNVAPRSRKSRISRDFEFYDRDARYCSQMNINLDCSSTDIIHNKRGNYNFGAASNPNEKKPTPHDVWEVLRNINRFQFNPSPPMSEESLKAPPKRKGGRRQNNQKDTRVVETCRTEEFAIISSYEAGSSHSLSRSSSFSIETVIDTQEDLSKFCHEFETNIMRTKCFPRTSINKSQIRNQNNKAVTNRNTPKPLTKAFTQKTNKQKGLPIEYTKKQNYNCGDTEQNRVSSPVYNNVHDEFMNDSFCNKVYEMPMLKKIDDDFISENNFTRNSGTSKVAITNECIRSGASSGLDTIGSTQINNPFNGITKVVLSKGPSKPSVKKAEHIKPIRKVSIATNQSSKFNFSPLIPKLTQTEVKRRLAKLKFPITVLGKDELSSSYEVNNTESMQFNGLNDKMWPFMEEWKNGGSVQQIKVKTKTDISLKKKHNPEILEINRTQKLNKRSIPPTQTNTDKRTNGFKSINKCKEEQKHIASPAELLNSAQPKKTKPIRQFKEKMLKLLYKNSSILSIDKKKDNTGEYSTPDTKHVNKATEKMDFFTDTCKIKSPQGAPLNRIYSPITVPKQVPIVKQPWAKARWASDFIDNVIKKIKNGVYYTQDSLSNKKQYLECKEAEIQTIATQSEPITVQSTSKITVKENDSVIPGFDNNSFPALEIHAMNMNQITVKHCVTNIMVHFDVTVPNEPVISLKKSSSLIPIKVTESQTKIFKCKSSIINAMLPAELCSILPNMWNVLEFGKARAFLPTSVAKPNHLTNIAEVTCCEIPKLFRPLALCLQMTMTPELQKISDGIFPKPRPPHVVHKKFVEIHFNRILAEELLSRPSIHHVFDCKAEVLSSINSRSTCAPNLSKTVDIDSKQLNICTALEPYTASNRTLVPSITKCNNLLSVLRRMRSYLTENISTYSRVFNYFFDKNITINLTTTNSNGLEDTLSIDLHKFMNGKCVNVLEASKNSLNILDNKRSPKIQHQMLKTQSNMNLLNSVPVNSRTKKKSFVKLYRKCKSTSNISGDKSTTPISKITNLDEFFQALGTAKLLCGVFDNAFAHKILTSLKEMKCWISDINPIQALLVFLLLNKKETANLLRYRPVLLQGIAVSRITRANELDMEIEVIEKETLNGLHQASDYQRTFDASSEKLLKSLLEKRKKLNPSYLRVMARYVGLGLLKTPVKK